MGVKPGQNSRRVARGSSSGTDGVAVGGTSSGTCGGASQMLSTLLN